MMLKNSKGVLHMKKFISVFLAFMMILVLLPGVALANNSISVIVNGQTIIFADQDPIIVDGRTFVPVAGVFQTLGFSTEWNPDTQQVTITRNTDTIVVAVGSNTFITNFVPHNLDVPAQIINGRTMLPIASVLRSVGYEVSWNDVTRTVVIVPMTQTEITSQTNFPAPPQTSTPPATGVDLSRTVWLSATGVRYHSINNCGTMNPARARSITRGEARDRGHQACTNCW